MKRILLLLAALFLSLNLSAAFAQETCESKAVSREGKPLAGAAKTSFLKKCKRDTCQGKAVGSKGRALAGAADRPPAPERFIPGLVEPSDRRVAVIGPFAHGVGVVDEAHEAGAAPRRGPFQHLLVAVGISEREDGTAADEAVDALGLSRLVVDELDLALAQEDGNVVRPHLVFGHGRR